MAAPAPEKSDIHFESTIFDFTIISTFSPEDSGEFLGCMDRYDCFMINRVFFLAMPGLIVVELPMNAKRALSLLLRPAYRLVENRRFFLYGRRPDSVTFTIPPGMSMVQGRPNNGARNASGL